MGDFTASGGNGGAVGGSPNFGGEGGGQSGSTISDGLVGSSSIDANGPSGGAVQVLMVQAVEVETIHLVQLQKMDQAQVVEVEVDLMEMQLLDRGSRSGYYYGFKFSPHPTLLL